MKRILALVALVVCSGLIFAVGTKEKAKLVSYPTKAIQVVIPAGAGGDTDLNARLIGKYLEKELGVPIVVVNIAGAGGTLGSRKVKDSPPDGYTVLFYHNNILLNNLLGLVDYSFEAFEIAGIALMDYAGTWAVSKKSNLKTLADLITEAKKNPKKISYATEVGAFSHLQVLAFQKATGTELNIVDIGGAAAKTAALMGGQIDIISTQYGLVKDYFKSGDFHSLGILAQKREKLLPNIPTFKEQGVDIVFDKFFFYGFPKNTPQEIVTVFSDALKTVLSNPDLIAEFENIFITAKYTPPNEAVAYMAEMKRYYETFKEMIVSSGVQKK